MPDASLISISTSDLIQLVIIFGTVFAAIVGFLLMQQRQNLAIQRAKEDREAFEEANAKAIAEIKEQHREEIKELQRKLSKQTSYNLETKDQVTTLVAKMDSVIEMMKELKDRGCGNCIDQSKGGKE